MKHDGVHQKAIERHRRDLWEQLLAKRLHMPHFLTRVRVQGIRDINDLAVGLFSPVMVIAGANASGKSTLLTAAACAYEVPGDRRQNFLPSKLFADWRPPLTMHTGRRTPATIEVEYSTPDGGRAMRWRRAKGWRQTFYGRRHASQPRRAVHMHLMRNLEGPAKAPALGTGTMGRRAATWARPLTLWERHLTEQMLPFRDSAVVERTLRLSQSISHLHDALILVDDVEAGLHPWAQQLLMLHLQRLSLFNSLQFVVTTQSSVVLESVHPLARVSLGAGLH